MRGQMRPYSRFRRSWDNTNVGSLDDKVQLVVVKGMIELLDEADRVVLWDFPLGRACQN